ncbi:MAG: bifunctional folylpolyglutamate synthase/dihydrofolate synthase [Candidatus Eisenbacteria bacterium]|nr:bifunctional folylpolyglutamate synthase/dihydrofolate synthase [Candidatus Eisenbacteria bacterium]
MRFDLGGTRSLLKKLGNPHRGFSSVLVAGTNGKGSTCSFLSSILNSAGHETGLYTSPHLVDFRERIRVSGGCIPREHAMDLLSSVVPIGERGGHSFFETLTGLAFRYFHDRRVPMVVAEVGLGGRLDSTNVLSPLVSVITGVSIEHSHILGATLSAIAGEKAGIIRRRRPVVTAARGKALETIEKRAADLGAEVLRLGRELRVTRKFESRAGSVFSARLAGAPTGAEARGSTDYFVGLRGAFQVRNAGCAILAASCLREMGVDVDDSALQDGLSRAQWPGRLEEWGWTPCFLFDVAHNPEAASRLAEALSTLYAGKSVVAVVGMVRDKDHRRFLGRLLPRVRHVVFTQAACDRAVPAEELKDCMPQSVAGMGWSRVGGKASEGVVGKTRGKAWSVTPGVPQAMDAALSIAGKDELVCVTGSFYTVGEAMQCLGIGVRERV